MSAITAAVAPLDTMTIDRILGATRQSVLCGHDFIPDPARLDHMEENWTKFGMRYIQLLKADYALDRARDACWRATGWPIEEASHGDELRVDVAVAQFSVGRCGELTALLALRLLQEPQLSEVFRCTFSPHDRRAPHRHAVVLIGCSKEEIERCANIAPPGSTITIEDMLKQLPPTAHLIDPLLKCHGPVANYSSSPTYEYNAHFHISQLRHIGTLSKKLGQDVLELGRIIYARAKEIAKNQPLPVSVAVREFVSNIKKTDGTPIKFP